MSVRAWSYIDDEHAALIHPAAFRGLAFGATPYRAVLLWFVHDALGQLCEPHFAWRLFRLHEPVLTGPDRPAEWPVKAETEPPPADMARRCLAT